MGLAYHVLPATGVAGAARPYGGVASGVAGALSGLLLLPLHLTAYAWLGGLGLVTWAIAAVLEALPGRARVLNEYELGGWLLWAARDTTPAIDGRTEVFAVDYVDRYKKGLDMEPGWRRLVQDADADAALLFEDTPLVQGLLFLGWQVETEQDSLVVLLPPTEQ